MQVNTDFGPLKLTDNLASRFSRLPRQSGRVVWSDPLASSFAHHLRRYIFTKFVGIKSPFHRDGSGMLDEAFVDG
jgi:hypothetical protein